jgi:hypothetical protein
VLKLIRLSAAIFILLLIIMISIGIFAPKYTYLSRTQVIKSPVNLVWRQIITIDNYTKWQRDLKKVTLNKGDQLWNGATVRFYRKEYEASVFHEEQVTAMESDKSITLQRTGLNENPLLRDYQTSYSLKPLLDGTTEITIEISYQPASFVTRIYNQLLLKSSISSICNENLIALRDLIENS